MALSQSPLGNTSLLLGVDYSTVLCHLNETNKLGPFLGELILRLGGRDMVKVAALAQPRTDYVARQFITPFGGQPKVKPDWIKPWADIFVGHQYDQDRHAVAGFESFREFLARKPLVVLLGTESQHGNANLLMNLVDEGLSVRTPMLVTPMGGPLCDQLDQRPTDELLTQIITGVKIFAASSPMT